MEEIIRIITRRIGNEDVNAVDARELHVTLESKRDFATWIVARIEQLDLTEGVDFVRFIVPPSGGAEGNRGVRHDYALALDAAKHVALAERTDRGKLVRTFFIEAERKLRSFDPLAALNDPNALRGLLLGYTEKVLALEETVAARDARLEEVAGAIELHERIDTARGHHTFTDAAKTLGVHPRRLVEFLLDRKYVYRRTRQSKKTGRLIATERWLHLKAPLFYVAVSERITPAGESIQAQQTYVTPAGLERFAAEIVDWTPPAAEGVAA